MKTKIKTPYFWSILTSLLILAVVLSYFYIGKTKPSNNDVEAVVEDKSIKEIELLLKKGWNIDTRGYFNDTSLIVAAARGKIKKVKFFLEHGADINAVNMVGRTALMRATVNKKFEMIELLKKKEQV